LIYKIIGRILKAKHCVARASQKSFHWCCDQRLCQNLPFTCIKKPKSI
jgi:hypothetical protein